MQYLSIYSDEGERITSFVTGVHGDTAEELKELAKKEYPDNISVLQTESQYNEAMKGDLLYINGNTASDLNRRKKKKENRSWRHLITNMQRKSALLRMKWQERKLLKMKIITTN